MRVSSMDLCVEFRENAVFEKGAEGSEIRGCGDKVRPTSAETLLGLEDEWGWVGGETG